MIKRSLRKLRKHLEDVLKIKTSPYSIALGFALGTLIAILPTFGLGLFIGLAIILVFKKISKISMVIAFAVWNPLVLFFCYGLSYKIGDFLLKGFPVKTYSIEILNKLFVYPRRFLLGNFILAITMFILSYFIIFFAARYYQKKHPLEKIEEFVEEIIQ